MRTIKFCAIISGTKKWIYGLPNSVYSENDIDAIFDLKTRNVEYIRVDTLREFTNQLDIKKREIYVGDVLSEKWKAEVYQNNDGTFMVKFHTNPGQNKPMTLNKYLKHRKKAGTANDDNLIIGNIYSNPELL